MKVATLKLGTNIAACSCGMTGSFRLCEFGRKKGYACKYRLRIEFPHDSNIVDLYRSEAEHDHQAIASVNPLTAEVKDKIREYAKARLQPQRIRVLLSVLSSRIVRYIAVYFRKTALALCLALLKFKTSCSA